MDRRAQPQPDAGGVVGACGGVVRAAGWGV